MPHLTDLETQLSGEQGESVRQQHLQELQTELQSTKRKLQSGLSPNDYAREQAKVTALESAIEVLSVTQLS